MSRIHRAKERIDQRLVREGVAETRAKAQALILAGHVRVDDLVVDKPGKLVSPEARIEITGRPFPYVSRGGAKLEAALRTFDIDVRGLTCLDVGAGTGGFTDCLLSQGAAVVYAVDVGRYQLDWRLRQDPRVVVREGVNARYLTPDDFPVRFDLATIDVSFISLRKILPPIALLLVPAGAIVALIKPQFEAGRRDVGRGGIVRNPAIHDRVVREIRLFAESALGLRCLGTMESPLLGSDGNKEFFIYLRRAMIPADERSE